MSRRKHKEKTQERFDSNIAKEKRRRKLSDQREMDNAKDGTVRPLEFPEGELCYKGEIEDGSHSYERTANPSR